jgi:hypothetical protein
MRKIILSIAAAGAALAVASPASAQYYPAPVSAPYGYGYNGYNGYNGYGYNNGWGQIRSLQARIDNVERQINRLDRRDRIGDRGADRLREEADRIERRLHERARGGLNPNEARDIDFRIARLEQRVQYAMNDRYGRYGYGYGDRDDRWDRDHDRD